MKEYIRGFTIFALIFILFLTFLTIKLIGGLYGRLNKNRNGGTTIKNISSVNGLQRTKSGVLRLERKKKRISLQGMWLRYRQRNRRNNKRNWLLLLPRMYQKKDINKPYMPTFLRGPK